MVTTSIYPHIECDESGTPRIAKTRYSVVTLAAEHYYYGWSAEEMLRQHADLRPEQVYAALGYFYDNYQAMLETMNAMNERGEARLQNQVLSREQLLQRRSAAKG